MQVAADPVNILLVDDMSQNLLALHAVLDGEDCNLVTARSGEEALRCLLKDDFAVILLDVYMPGIDGLETAALIRQRERSHHTPIIFVTAAGHDENLVARGYLQGAVDYIVKPIEPQILQSKVAVFVELFRKRQQIQQQALQLSRMNEDLEARVAARTVQLEATVAELEQQIAERKRAEAEARAAARLREDFLSIASHELKTPLTSFHLALEGFARAIRSHSVAPLPPERVARLLETMERQDRRLTKLVDELLDVSRISGGQLQLEREQVDLSAVVHDVLARFEHEAARAGCPVALSVAEGVVGLWDRSRLEQVVTNLVSNALKYGAGKEIAIGVTCESGWTHLVVRDHGIGIAPESVARIFNRFERAVSANDYGGLGLGLFITRQIVEALGGSIAVTSEIGAGATFTVDLPLEPEQPPTQEA